MPLSINRRPGEGVELDGPAIVRIERSRKTGRVKLVIEAPDSTRIRRLELTDADLLRLTKAKRRD